MNRLMKMSTTVSAILVVAGSLAGAKPAAALQNGVYLWSNAFDSDISASITGYGDWASYKNWLNTPTLAAEVDGGKDHSWANTCEGWWNDGWGVQQQRYGTALPTVVLGYFQMPWDPDSSDWNTMMAWENTEWGRLASNQDQGSYVTLANNIKKWGYKDVIFRPGYEFDGGWDPDGNLNAMSNMPANYINAWRHMVTTIKNTLSGSGINVKFVWNPTDANGGYGQQINVQQFYPGDDYVDYIGIDEYDYDYGNQIQSQEVLNGKDGYTMGFTPTQTEQTNEWNDIEKPRLDVFAAFAASANTSRPGYVSGRSVPLIFGEWGTWQVAPSTHQGNPSGPDRPAGGDNPSYIQNMHTWMTTHNVYMQSYFEAPSDGVSTLWGAGLNPAWSGGTNYPKAAAMFKSLFGGSTASSNYISNPGFETGDLSSWNMWVGTNSGAAFAQNAGGDSHTGTWEYTNWSSSPYELTAYQSIAVPNGAHTVSAWIKSSGGQANCQMFVKYYDGGNVATVNIPASGGWIQISTTVNVTSGTLEVSFYSNASANQWLNVDDVTVN